MSNNQNNQVAQGVTKQCKYCRTDIPKKAKICPNCCKKQGSKLKWVIIIIVVIAIIAAVSGGEDEPKVKKVNNTNNEGKTTESESNTQQENAFFVGDTVETKDWRITFVSADDYVSDNQFIQPKDGYKYVKACFEFENISDSDHTVSSLIDWECYADSYKADQSYLEDDNGLDGTLSPGKKTQGCIFFEVPSNASEILFEYDIDFLEDDKINFYMLKP